MRNHSRDIRRAALATLLPEEQEILAARAPEKGDPIPWEVLAKEKKKSTKTLQELSHRAQVNLAAAIAAIDPEADPPKGRTEIQILLGQVPATAPRGHRTHRASVINQGRYPIYQPAPQEP